ncbi:hypothetical protein Q1695_011645 [Nippostrongylus brasiliensis]|nr:hypothetical protein Q1695_011645 [Nippostrongylus brasiliensis]
MVKRSCHRVTIIQLHRRGLSAREIHRRLGVHRSVIYTGPSSDTKIWEPKRTGPDEEGPHLWRFEGQQHRLILFTDEKLFTVEEVLNRQNHRVYAKSNPHVAVSRSSHPASVMVFAGVTADGKTPLWFVPKGVKVNSQNYLDLLKEDLLPWARSHFGSRSWTFQQDGAPAHRAAAVQERCNDNFPDFISLQEWPANSPDLNPMDYTVWSVLEAKACRKPHRSVDLLKKTLLKAWEELDLTYLRAAVDDFPMRLKACIEANGDIFEP